MIKKCSKLFSDIPEIIENNFNVAISCSYYPKEVKPKLPKFKNNLNLSESQLLVRMAKNGLIQKIKENKIKEKKQYENRLNFEIEIINKMGFAGYFLIVSDFVNWAKRK